MTRVVVHIDRLVLRGIARGNAKVFSEAFEQELQRLLADQDRLQPIIDGGDRARLISGHTSITANRAAAASGRQAANAVARRMRS